MIEHIKKLFLVIIVLSCFTCFQRADYNLPLFTFAFFLWDFKNSNVHMKIDSVPEIPYVLPVRRNLDRRLHLADLLGCHLGLRIIQTERLHRRLLSRADPLRHQLPREGTFPLTQLITIIMASVYDPDVKLAIRNIVPNLKGIFSYSPENY